MGNFTPADWIEIGTSLVSAWWFGRFMFMFVIGMFGTDLNEHTIKHEITVRIEDDD